ncbi:ATP-dependent DNA helicase RecG [Pleionea sp. CnH1-48]|uniref:ATP-dependent DNA helicase RecG n=1 Tax=Pleionea sp. CnH1-48 TaxID=2954494 RepID=UPI002096EF5A|nr:ATP-dependent DNA helicase RecG [Pleionea sp. CnH1-48]MCO7224544.1 ATP-dependent DNA helicase RecG [Pleionea sp. CnH1-48]
MDISQIKVSRLKGVGPAIEAKLEKLGIYSVQDLLFHLPHRYEDRTRIAKIGSLLPGQGAQVLVTVEKCDITFGKRRSLVCRVSDGSGKMDLRFFYFTGAQKSRYQPGVQLLCFGDVSPGRGALSMIHPEVKILKSEADAKMGDRLTPIYPVTEGVKQPTLRQLTDRALSMLEQSKLTDYLPVALREEYQLGSLIDALKFVHRPPVGVDLETIQAGSHPAKQRLAIEELLAHHLSLLRVRQKLIREPAQALPDPQSLNQQLSASLPFSLTGAQQRVIKEIGQDLNNPFPMLRLVQGDVGSGKTLVAAFAALQAIEAGFQVALMAPTEILAEQHWNNFSEWFAPLGISCAFLVSKLKVAEKRQMLADIASGDAAMVIGTHALFQNDVEFNRLALIIIDEQHRFGVDQRMALKDKGNIEGKVPHQLIMTATPIPRTLAMTAYADLESSIIDELPPGRKPVSTVVLPDDRRDQVVQRVANVCREQKRQAYWVCTLIEESEEVQCQAAEDTAQQLALALSDMRVGLVHGRMKPFDKQMIMEQFKAGEIDLLVATTVIEVGVDVPNASLMVIENPERLGLAQLHQLRGRVGRGSAESHCVLMYHAPLSKQGRARMEVMRETNDGFLIAEKDLELRGPGEVLGTRQTGLVQFKVADILRDRPLLPKVNEMARQVIQQQPQLADAIILRWLGKREDYAQV